MSGDFNSFWDVRQFLISAGGGGKEGGNNIRG